MTEEPIAQALARIELALDRAESAAREAGELAHRHARLKASVARSLHELDSLLEKTGK
ncbi:hypothetical protein [Novosphingobium colocasiae]|uniref:Uncharacterized protein n=1 Tax=Novosphingobium colocasiae TaxID=1256513 RepID=A0A918UGL3_9SPHN|nr:hypothetical protein [Novosphingobium colocasiae]GGZ08837.1 hypothetical protein GCM10011614_24680 [Novosphingobium colocasiae]